MLLLAQTSPKSKVGPQTSEVGTGQRLSEDICDIVMTGDAPNGKGSIINAFANEVVADINVFTSGMVSGVG